MSENPSRRHGKPEELATATRPDEGLMDLEKGTVSQHCFICSIAMTFSREENPHKTIGNGSLDRCDNSMLRIMQNYMMLIWVPI